MTETRTPARNRDLWLDTLRTLAIIRVVTYHTFGGSWLTWIFPSMGVMFALAGGLMVRSLDRSGPGVVIKNRFRRLLPAFWLYGAIMVSLMLAHGWMHDQDSPLHYWQLLFYVVPVLDPPSSTWGANYAVILWYLRTYLWFVALSPLLLKAFRRSPIATLVAPLALILPGVWALNRVYQMPDNFGTQFGGLSLDLIITVGTYAGCWILGMAHREGYLKKFSTPVYTGVTVSLAVVGIAVALKFPNSDPGAAHDLDGLPVAQAFWSMAFVMALLRVSPDVSWLARTPVLGKLVVLVNARAVTIYLWHNYCIDLAPYIDDRVNLIPFMDQHGIAESVWFQYAVAWVLVGVAIVLFGWVEDLAARRKPRLFPWEAPGGGGKAERPAAASVPAADAPVPTASVPAADRLVPAGFVPAERFAAATGFVPVATATAPMPAMDYPERGHDDGYGPRSYPARTYGSARVEPAYQAHRYDDVRRYDDEPGYDEGRGRVYRSDVADRDYPDRAAADQGYGDRGYAGREYSGGAHSDQRGGPDDRRYRDEDRYPDRRYEDDRRYQDDRRHQDDRRYEDDRGFQRDRPYQGEEYHPGGDRYYRDPR